MFRDLERASGLFSFSISSVFTPGNTGNSIIEERSVLRSFPWPLFGQVGKVPMAELVKAWYALPMPDIQIQAAVTPG
jgi:hypothetical protein